MMNGDTAEFSLEPGEWIVLASPTQNSSAFVPTYSGNTLEWINAEHIIIPEKGITLKEITCLVPGVAVKGTGQISGYVYEKAGLRIKKCFLLHLNSEYTRKGKINPKELFVKEDITKQKKKNYN